MSSRKTNDAQGHEKTASISFRLPEELVEKIRTEAQISGLSSNVLVARILDRYLKWDSIATKAGYMPVTKKTMIELLARISDKELGEISEDIMRKEYVDMMYLFKNDFTIETVFEEIEERAKVSGFPFRHMRRGNLHSFIIQHDVSPKWSVYLASRYRAVFEELGQTGFKFRPASRTLEFDVVPNSDNNSSKSAENRRIPGKD